MMKKEQIKKLIEKNDKQVNVKIQSGIWTIKYNKKEDMLIMGEKIMPKQTFYVSIEDSGLLIRIDENNIIYGFAIENAKCLAKENPSLKMVLNTVRYPILMKVISSVRKTFSNMNVEISDSVAIKNYIQKYSY